MVADAKRPSALRVGSLRALESLKDDQLNAMAQAALDGKDPRLRHEARRILLAKRIPRMRSNRWPIFSTRARPPGTAGGARAPRGHEVRAGRSGSGGWLDRLLDKKAPPELELDILEAARKRSTGELKKKLTQYEKKPAWRQIVAAIATHLSAATPRPAGRFSSISRSVLPALPQDRRHRRRVGPELAGIGAKQKREYLLESIVDPNKDIAKASDSIVLVLTDGQTKTGILKSEDAKEVRLMTAEGHSSPSQGPDRRASPGLSAMPADLVDKMSRSELRDLVEFLANLREEMGPEALARAHGSW